MHKHKESRGSGGFIELMRNCNSLHFKQLLTAAAVVAATVAAANAATAATDAALNLFEICALSLLVYLYVNIHVYECVIV